MLNIIYAIVSGTVGALGMRWRNNTYFFTYNIFNGRTALCARCEFNIFYTYMYCFDYNQFKK